MELKVYRHKQYKNLYLAGDYKSFKVTEDITYAISMQDAFDNEGYNEGCQANQYVTYRLIKQHRTRDGFKGALTKDAKLYIKDFEPVIFKEV